ncbi:MAG: zinc-binding dehydrogenase [Pirellulaceae bacterium]
MKTTAAVLVEPRHPLELVELTVPVLRPGQVLVEIAYSGVCHTQVGEWLGERGPDHFLPHCLGHEGSGQVVDVGPGVTHCQPGDRVVLSWIKGPGIHVPGTQYDWNGRTVNAGGVTTFSRHSVVSENRVTVVSDELPMRAAALLGCAIPTGFGMVFNTARLQAGQSVAVMGTGGIGLCAIMAAAIAGAAPIVAVDIEPQRLAVARQVGATHAINGRDEDPAEALRRILPHGLDVAIEASGKPEVMEAALAAVRSQGGVAVVAGNAPFGQSFPLDPRQLNQGKQLRGTWGGETDPARDFPRYSRLLLSGKASIEPLLDREYTLEQINDALDDLRACRTARPLIRMTNHAYRR